MSNYKTRVTTDTDLRHNGAVVVMTDADNVTILELDPYDELPIAARLAVELLKAAGACEQSDEPSTRQTAREHLLELVRLASDLLVVLDDADAEGTTYDIPAVTS